VVVVMKRRLTSLEVDNPIWMAQRALVDGVWYDRCLKSSWCSSGGWSHQYCVPAPGSVIDALYDAHDNTGVPRALG